MSNKRIEELRKKHDDTWANWSASVPLTHFEVNELFAHIDTLEAQAKLDAEVCEAADYLIGFQGTQHEDRAFDDLVTAMNRRAAMGGGV